MCFKCVTFLFYSIFLHIGIKITQVGTYTSIHGMCLYEYIKMHIAMAQTFT